MHRDKIRKILKFEKVMKKFCREIGIDKRSLMGMMLGGGRDIESSNAKADFNSSRKDATKDSGQNSIVKDSGTINTGVAAQLAYNNMI